MKYNPPLQACLDAALYICGPIFLALQSKTYFCPFWVCNLHTGSFTCVSPCQVGWSRANLVKKLQENPRGVTLVLRKIPGSLRRKDPVPQVTVTQVRDLWSLHSTHLISPPMGARSVSSGRSQNPAQPQTSMPSPPSPPGQSSGEEPCISTLFTSIGITQDGAHTEDGTVSGVEVWSLWALKPKLETSQSCVEPLHTRRNPRPTVFILAHI